MRCLDSITDSMDMNYLAAAARSESLSWNRALGWGSLRAYGERGDRTGSAPGAGQPPGGEGRGSVVSGQGWRSQLYSWGLPLQLVMHRERAKGGVQRSAVGPVWR